MTGYPPPALDNMMLRSEAEIGQNSSISILSVKTYVELLVELKYNIFCGPLCNMHCQGIQISASADWGPRSRVCARETLRSAPHHH